MMAHPRTCPECGASIPEAATACGRCLLRGAAAAPDTLISPVDSLPAPFPPPAQKPASTTVRYFGDYELLEEIAVGGMGAVWRARQRSLNRLVAVKMLLPGLVNTEERLRRFRTEAEAAAALKHPNIVAIHEVGEHEGQHYFSMDLIAGEDLAQRTSGALMDTSEAAACLRVMAFAIDHAHQRGVLHRDLKPANVIRSPDGEPHVTDFGLAKLLESAGGPTRTGQIMGTPGFMAPELASPQLGAATTATDVYGLGAILYFLLTGHPPFEAQTLEQTLLAITTRDPVAPRTRRASIPQDLEVVCLKCLCREPARRYAGAREVADELGRFLQHEPIHARPASVLQRLQLWHRREPAMAMLCAAFFLSLTAGLAAALAQWRNAVHERDRAVRAEKAESQQRISAERSSVESRQRLVQVNVGNGLRAGEDHDAFGALFWFVEALRNEIPGSRGDKVQRYRIGGILEQLPRLSRLWVHGTNVADVDLSPDGRWTLTAGQDGAVRIWPTTRDASGIGLPHGKPLRGARFSRDSHHVISVDSDESIRVWKVPTGSQVGPTLVHRWPVLAALATVDGSRVFAACNEAITRSVGDSSFRELRDSSEILVWSVSNGSLLRRWEIPGLRVHRMALSPAGDLLAAAIGTDVVCWRLTRGDALRIRSGSNPEVEVIPGLADDNRGAAPEARLPDCQLGRPGRGGASAATCIAFNSDGSRLLVALGDGTTRLWNTAEPGARPLQLETPGRQEQTPGLLTTVTLAAFVPGAGSLLTVDSLGAVRSYSARTGSLERMLAASTQGQMADLDLGGEDARLSLNPDGRYAFIGNQVWDLGSNEAVSSRPLHWGAMRGVFSPDGAGLLTVDPGSGVARMWSLATLLPVKISHEKAPLVAQGPQDPDTQLDGPMRSMLLQLDSSFAPPVFSADGTRLLTMAGNGVARGWRTETGAPATPWIIERWPMVAGAFSRDGTRVAIVGGYVPEQELGAGRIWDAGSGRPVTPLLRGPRRFTRCEFTPDARWLLTETSDEAQIWDVTSGARVRLPEEEGGQRARVLGVTPDGKWMAGCLRVAVAGRADVWQTRVWSAETHQLRLELAGETNEVTSFHFTPDSRWLLVLSKGAHEMRTGVGLWSLEKGQRITAGVPEWVTDWNSGFTAEAGTLVLSVLQKPLRPLGEVFAFDYRTAAAIDTHSWEGWRKHIGGVPFGLDRLVVADKQGLGVFDVLGGDSLMMRVAKPGRQLGSPAITALSAHNLFAVAGDREVQIFRMASVAHTVADLTSLARLLSGREASGLNDFAQSSPATASNWAALRERVPELFSVGQPALRRWRELVVAKAELAASWHTVLFHLARLVEEFPGDAELRGRFDHAQERSMLQQLAQ